MKAALALGARTRAMLPPRRIRVFLADDHPVFLEGLARAVRERPCLELVGSATDGQEALAGLRRLGPDVAVLDVRMGAVGGREILAAVTRESLPTRVLFLSAYLEDDLVYGALAAGAAGYLSKEMDRDAILDAVVAGARGEVVLSREVQTGVAREIRRREALRRPRLTARELEILALAAQGSSTPQIAGSLHLSAATVKTHLQNVYDKLGVTDRTSAVAVALRRGLLD
jgi:two-component system, NarL family, nitrate/nitrite response regulator NarL